jgi:hypothetical protein
MESRVIRGGGENSRTGGKGGTRKQSGCYMGFFHLISHAYFKAILFMCRLLTVCSIHRGGQSYSYKVTPLRN